MGSIIPTITRIIKIDIIKTKDLQIIIITMSTKKKQKNIP